MNQEKPSSVEISPEMRIRGCVNLDELYFVIRDLKEIPGGKRIYTSDEVIDRIKKAAEVAASGALGVVEEELGRVTRGYDIRDKARELISKQIPKLSS